MTLRLSTVLLIQVLMFAAVAAEEDTCQYDGDCFSNHTPCCCSDSNWDHPSCTESHAACEELHGGDASWGCGSRACTEDSDCAHNDTCCINYGEDKGLCMTSCICESTYTTYYPTTYKPTTQPPAY